MLVNSLVGIAVFIAVTSQFTTEHNRARRKALDMLKRR